MDEKVGVDYREASLYDVNMTFQKACNIFSLSRPALIIRAEAVPGPCRTTISDYLLEVLERLANAAM